MEAVPELRGRKKAFTRVPREMRRRVYGGLAYVATPLAPLAAYLLWRQYHQVGNLSSLWMCIAYAILSVSLLVSLALLRARRLEGAVASFAYPAALLLGFQMAISPPVIIGVSVSEMMLLMTIGFVVMEAEQWKLFVAVQGALALVSLFLRHTSMPPTLAFPEWDLFNRQIVPLAIFLVFQLAVIFLAVQLNALLGSLNGQREELARKNEDLRLFFHAASHDLRQPLRQVLGFARLLEKRHRAQLADEAREYLGFIEQVSGRMEGLLDALLRYVDLGERTLELEAVDLNEPLRAAQRGLAAALANAKAAVEAETLPVVQGQAALLEEVFKSLLDNCVKYRHPERPLKVSVSARKAGQGWELRVDDNGIGIPANVRSGLFQAFHRGHPPAHYPGYGIGLAYCRRIIELQGGSIHAEEKTEPGARIAIFLPQAALSGAPSSKSH